jgi:hypothetical protein
MVMISIRGGRPMRRTIRAIFGVAILVGLNGCSRESGNRVQPVHGRVLYNGKPVANAQVTFHPVGDVKRGAIRPVGKVDDQGNFTLTSFKDGDGAPLGEYQVTVVWYLARQTRPGSDETVSANYLPVKYANVETSQLTATVTAGSNELPAFDLK